MTHVQYLKPFLKETPFHAAIEPLMHGNGWVRWQGYYSPAFYDSEQSEYFATRHGASVYDVSPLIKYSITGKDAARFANFLVTRDLTRIKPMNAAYTAWCDDDGKMLEEGTIFRLGENEFLLNAALHQLHWLSDASYGFDVRIEEVSETLAGLSLQGPNSRAILQAMGIAGIENLPHFGIMETSLDGKWLRIDRAGFTGDLGYELWVKPADALWLWETLFRIGNPYKIAPMGSLALDMVRIEAGFILVDVDYIGAKHAIRPTKPGKQELGLTTSAMWSPHLKKNLAFAKVPPAYAKPGTEMWIEIWYGKEQKIERSMVKCWARNRMFFDPPRKKAMA
jgi:aminomethyltransferase